PLAPPPLSPLKFSPGPQTATTCTLVTPVGTLNSCCPPAYLNSLVSANALLAPSRPSAKQHAVTPTATSAARVLVLPIDMRPPPGCAARPWWAGPLGVCVGVVARGFARLSCSVARRSLLLLCLPC